MHNQKENSYYTLQSQFSADQTAVQDLFMGAWGKENQLPTQAWKTGKDAGYIQDFMYS